ncbi:MAG: ADOP family duplicated permease [Gemmatimonadaceae bacterium]
MIHDLPRLPAAVLRALLPRAERDELLRDIAEEYEEIAAHSGRAVATRWLWRQASRSAPMLVGWNWWRHWTGFESRANAFRPGGLSMRTWFTDAHYAARRLRARPVYALIAILTLSLGIGGTAAVFGIARPVILDRLPYANTNKVGTFWMPGWWTEEEFLYLRGKVPGFQLVGAQRPGDVTMRTGDDPARLLPGLTITGELFDVLGARPLIGRGPRVGDDVEGAEPVAFLSYGLWQELGGKPSIIGTRITLDDVPRTVVGVMPKSFWYPNPTVRIWLPKALDPQGRNGSYTLLGLTAPGVDVHNLDPYIKRLTAIIGQRFTYAERADKTKSAKIVPMREELLGSIRPAIIATFAAMALILLIACTNVAALMLGQVEGRASELAVRSALGATRTRIARQLVVEALLIGVAAAVVGGIFAALGFGVLVRALPIGAWADASAFDWTMFAAAFLLAIIAVLAITLVPAFSLWRADIRGALIGARTSGIQGRGGRLERGLVIAEVALAMLIASGAALLVRSVSKMYALDPGIDTKGIAVVDVLGSRSVRTRDRARAIEALRAALASMPGVLSAAEAMKIPLRGGGDSFGITIDGKPEAERTFTYFRIVSRDYFNTLGIKLKAGRTFDASDREQADTLHPEMSVVVNEAFAKTYFPNENPIGRMMGGGFNARQRVIGIVGNVAEAGLTDDREPVRYYLAGEQAPWFGENHATFVLRAKRAADATGLLEAARRTVQRLEPGYAIQETTTMDRVLDNAVGPARQIMSLLTLLSVLALVLGAVGIYGVIAHFAERRKRDWAIRVALGLPGSLVVRHIVSQGATLVIFGVLFGAIGTVLLARLLVSFLFNVSTVDPVAFLAASFALLLVGIAAALIPAWRAGSVDPATVLREA